MHGSVVCWLCALAGPGRRREFVPGTPDPRLTQKEGRPQLLGQIGALSPTSPANASAGGSLGSAPVFWALELILQAKLDAARTKLCWRRWRGECLPAPLLPGRLRVPCLMVWWRW